MNLRERIEALLRHEMVKPALARLRPENFSNNSLMMAAAEALQRRGWRYCLFALLSDVSIAAVLVALADRREGLFKTVLLGLWLVRLIIFMQRAGYDLTTTFLGRGGEDRYNRIVALLAEARFPANSGGLDPRAYLASVMDSSSAHPVTRLKAETMLAEFTRGLTHAGIVQEWIATHIFAKALAFHSRHRGA